MLPVEVMVLTLYFDMGSLRGRLPGAWVLDHSHHLPRMTLAIVPAALLFGGTRLLNEVREVAEQAFGSRRRWAHLLGHLLALTAFTALTAVLLDEGTYPSAESAWPVVAWLMTGAATLVFWVATMLPPGLWPRLAHRLSVPLLAGLAVGIVAWVAGRLTDQLWRPLSSATLRLVRALLGLATGEIVCRPADYVIGARGFSVQIAPECSGYEGIGLIWALLGAYLWLYRRTLRFPHAFLLLPLGTAAIWLANAARITILIAIGTWGSRDVALGGFRSQAGWIAFNAVSPGLIAWSRRDPPHLVVLSVPSHARGLRAPAAPRGQRLSAGDRLHRQ